MKPLSIPRQVEQRIVAAAPSAAGFRRPVAHVLLETAAGWSAASLRDRFQSWFWGDTASWRAVVDPDADRLLVEVDGVAFVCRLVTEPWSADRIAREVGDGAGAVGVFAAGLAARHTARVTISPDVSLGGWVSAPQRDRRNALDAMTRLVAVHAALDHALAVAWPVARALESARDAAAAALTPSPALPWARIIRSDVADAPNPAAGATPGAVAVRSVGLSQLAGFELNVAHARAVSVRRLVGIASEVLDIVVAGPAKIMHGPFHLPSGRLCDVSRSFDRTANAVELRIDV